VFLAVSGLLLLLLLMVLVVVVVMLKRQLVAAISVTSLHLRSSCRVSQLVIARRRSVAAARRRRRPPLHAAVWCVVAGAVISRCGVVLVAVPSLPRQLAGARQLPGVAAATDSDHPHALHRNNISIYY